MIRYTLTCPAGHGFDSWFQNAAAFDALALGGQLACPVCGSPTVEKTLMAPSVRPGRKAATAETPANSAATKPASPLTTEPASDLEKALAALRQKVESESEYVGMNFAAEARRIHDGDAPERSIYGQARPEEAKKLLEDGVPVAPLPFLPSRKTN